jgi:3-hydroxymyristoyl/3-hydroxydecanoyl-(acyl carrier protein) dehydratase
MTDCALPAYAPEHPAFAGHFPGNPIVPGVLLLDAALHHLGATHAGLGTGACRISNVKFLSVVRAGEDLRLSHDAPQASHADGDVHFVVLAGDRKVTSGSLRAAAPGLATAASNA